MTLIELAMKQMQALLYDLLLFYQQQTEAVEMGQFTLGRIVAVTLLAGIKIFG